MKQVTHSIKYGNGNNNDVYHHWTLTIDMNKKALDNSKIIQEQNKKCHYTFIRKAITKNIKL